MKATMIVQQLGNWTQSRGPLHGRLSAAFERAIEQGLILPGTRLPAERILAEALTLGAVLEHRSPVDIQRPATDVATFQLGPAHSGAYPFDDQVPLQLGDGADDDDDGAAQRAARVDVLPEADELDLQVVELYLAAATDGPL